VFIAVVNLFNISITGKFLLELGGNNAIIGK
jgi:hypothetical protein